MKVPGKKGEVELTVDEHPRRDDAESLGKLPPVFKAEGGTVTAGNSSGHHGRGGRAGRASRSGRARAR